MLCVSSLRRRHASLLCIVPILVYVRPKPVGYCIYLIGWLTGMLLFSRSGLVEEDAVEVFHSYGFHLSSSFLMYNFNFR